MEVEFKGPELKEMAYDPNYKGNWPPSVVKAFRRRLNFIIQAENRKDLYAFRSLHLEKLKGQRQKQHSLRLNKQYRLIIEFKSGNGREKIIIYKIEDYH